MTKKEHLIEYEKLKDKIKEELALKYLKKIKEKKDLSLLDYVYFKFSFDNPIKKEIDSYFASKLSNWKINDSFVEYKEVYTAGEEDFKLDSKTFNHKHKTGYLIILDIAVEENEQGDYDFVYKCQFSESKDYQTFPHWGFIYFTKLEHQIIRIPKEYSNRLRLPRELGLHTAIQIYYIKNEECEQL